MVKFVSYTGKFPCFCHGVLTIEINGEVLEMENVIYPENFCDRDTRWNIAWHFCECDIEPHKAEIVKVVNENLLCGCCGGCL